MKIKKTSLYSRRNCSDLAQDKKYEALSENQTHQHRSISLAHKPFYYGKINNLFTHN